MMCDLCGNDVPDDEISVCAECDNNFCRACGYGGMCGDCLDWEWDTVDMNDDADDGQE